MVHLEECQDVQSSCSMYIPPPPFTAVIQETSLLAEFPTFRPNANKILPAEKPIC